MKSLANPVVSIITVCYNSADVIASAIESVLSQRYASIEYIIVDGGSTDDTLGIIKSFGDSVSRLISEPDQGIYDAMNKGIAVASGEIIGLLNSDDFYQHNEVISEAVNCFRLNRKAEIVLGSVDYVRPKNLQRSVRYYSSVKFAPWKMRFGFMPPHPAAFIKQKAYKKVGLYETGYRIGADFEWFVRAFLVERLSYVRLNRALVRMREGGVSTAGLSSYWLSTTEQLQSLRSHGIYSNMLFLLVRLPIKYLSERVGCLPRRG